MTCHCKEPNKFRALLALAAGLILICVLVSWITSALIVGGQDWKHDTGHGHEWLHQKLNLTEMEAAAIDALEPAYRRDRGKLQGQFQAKIEQLRKQITGSDKFTKKVNQTIHELHLIHGQLQELSIRHYYEMMQALPTDKQDRLRDLAAEALSTPE